MIPAPTASTAEISDHHSHLAALGLGFPATLPGRADQLIEWADFLLQRMRLLFAPTWPAR
jgi:hypothetical protein